MEVLKPKIEAYGLADVLMMAASKQITERLMSPVIGNASVKSGVIKGIVGGLMYGKAGKIGNAVAGGLVFDAAEDLVVALLGGILGGGQTQGNAPNPYGL